jgi:hypothetical protein
MTRARSLTWAEYINTLFRQYYDFIIFLIFLDFKRFLDLLSLSYNFETNGESVILGSLGKCASII